MWLTPHDMAKFGLLYLNKGVWENKQIVPKQWVEQSTKKIAFPQEFHKVIDKNGDLMVFRSIWVWLAYNFGWSISDGYGYQWWTDDSGIYSAIGYGGQYIMVVPEKNMVVVFTSALKDTDFSKPGKLLKEYIIPAVLSDKLIPSNGAELKRLKSNSKPTADSLKPVSVPSLPEMAQKISGQTYKYDYNRFEFESFTLTFQPGKKEALLEQVVSYRERISNVGLDGVYRVTDRIDSQMAMKGHWIDKDTFRVFYKDIGNTTRGHVNITFEDKKMIYSVDDFFFGKFELIGRAE